MWYKSYHCLVDSILPFLCTWLKFYLNIVLRCYYFWFVVKKTV
nr:MAG TPA: hypothetical protein [Bacteriophage sp.]